VHAWRPATLRGDAYTLVGELPANETQVSDWSSTVGCWWSARTDPGEGPPTPELFAEFPMRPDGITGAIAWFERELRRPLVEQVRRHGIVCRRDWLVALDDGDQLALH
jgi:hypothetical protein